MQNCFHWTTSVSPPHTANSICWIQRTQFKKKKKRIKFGLVWRKMYNSINIIKLERLTRCIWGNAKSGTVTIRAKATNWSEWHLRTAFKVFSKFCNQKFWRPMSLKFHSFTCGLSDGALTNCHLNDLSPHCTLCAQACPPLYDPTDCSPPGSSVHGILQARILEWVAMPFSRGTSRPTDRTCISCIFYTGRWILYHHDI